MNEAWTDLTTLCRLESPKWYNGMVSVSWPFDEWLDYVQSRAPIWSTVGDAEARITLIIRGDGYLVAGCNGTQLNVSILDHGKLAGTTSHCWVIGLAYANDLSQFLPRVLSCKRN